MEESWFLSILDNISTDREKTTKEKQLLDQVFGIDLICQSICQLVPHKALQTLRKTTSGLFWPGPCPGFLALSALAYAWDL